MKAIILTTIGESVLSTNRKENLEDSVDYDSHSFIKKNLNCLKDYGVDELIIVEADELNRYIDDLRESTELGIRIKIIPNPFFKNTNSLATLWMALSEIEDGALIITWDEISNQDSIEFFIKYSDGESCFLMRDKEPVYEQLDTNVKIQDQDIVQIHNASVLKSRILYSSICISKFEGSGLKLIRESIEKEIRTVGAMRKEYVSAYYRLMNKEHVVCKVKSLDKGGIYKILPVYHRGVYKTRIFTGNHYRNTQRKVSLKVVSTK